ncbi:hypothetical protein [Actinomycetospora termitidis]|uniref:Lipoprotein n=1 Tax=Actinomycetospora termitidis TaxID=3053470 RepID=A0ABT7M313_9PSEU|nr:hypothetical protein [Actinomycetospora sp. Odt1-22]MDL5155058.1 hypothetical protein [Actinomycetospora sp. Odt1-22]
MRSRLAAALLLVALGGLAACDTSGAPPLPAPVSVPSAVPGAPAPDSDDDGTVAPPPAGQDQDDDGPDDDGPDDDN